MDTERAASHLRLVNDSGQSIAEPIAELHAAAVQPEVVQQPYRLRRFLGKAALVGAIFVSAGTVGTMLHGSNTQVAGQNVNSRETFDNRLTIHTGLPGTLSIPMDNLTSRMHGLGAEVRISDAPDASVNDATAITSLFANVGPDVKAARNKMEEWFALYGLMGVGSAYAVSKTKLINPRYKDRLTQMLGGYDYRVNFALAASVLAVGALPATMQKLEPKPQPNVSHAFDGTILEHATATGWMKVLINQVGVDAVNRIESINMFSGKTTHNLRKAFQNEPKLFKTAGTVTVVGFEGLKCNPAMMPVIGEAIRGSRAAFAVDAGDDVIGQADLDKLCLDRLASQTKGTDVIVADGNHRTSQTTKQAEDTGFTELKAGQIIKKNGLTIVGAPDPYPDAALQPKPEDPGYPKRKALGDALAQNACTYQFKTGSQISLGVMNQPGAASRLADSGCVDTVLTGGVEDGIKQTGGGETTYVFEKGAGGANLQPGVIDTSNLEPPKVPVNIYSYTFDKHSGKQLYSKVITVYPSYDVVITPPRLTPFASSPTGKKILFGS